MSLAKESLDWSGEGMGQAKGQGQTKEEKPGKKLLEMPGLRAESGNEKQKEQMGIRDKETVAGNVESQNLS